MIKLLYPFIKNYRKEAILSMLIIFLEAVMEIFMPLVMSKLIDEGINVSNFDLVRHYSFIIIGLVALQVTFGVLSAKFAILASSGFASELRQFIFSKIQTFSFANIDKFSTGSLVTRTTTDVENIMLSFQMMIRGVIRSLTLIIFCFVMIFKIYNKVGIIFISMLPFLVVGFLLIAKISVPIFDAIFNQIDKLNNLLSENIRGIRVVKTFNRESYEEGKFKHISNIIYKKSVLAEGIAAFGEPGLNIVVCILVICIAWFGAKEIIASGDNPNLGLTTGALTSLISYGLQILTSCILISIIYIMIIISGASVDRILEIVKEKSSIVNCDNPIYEFKNGDIEFKNVNFAYKENSENALKNFNIKINKGECIGVIGGTGCGKSTFVNLIPRLYDCDSGEVLISGINVKNYDIKTLRENIGMVLQKPVLFSGTISSNLKFGNENATFEEIKNASIIADADGFIMEKENQYDAIVEQNGTNFSGGQKQRLCIARAIIKKPKILIFDDSTSAVDTKTDAYIRDSLKTKLPNTTKIIIGQRVLTMMSCDRIVFMKDGEILGFDTHENLLKTCEEYKELYILQQKGASDE